MFTGHAPRTRPAPALRPPRARPMLTQHSPHSRHTHTHRAPTPRSPGAHPARTPCSRRTHAHLLCACPARAPCPPPLTQLSAGMNPIHFTNTRRNQNTHKHIKQT